MSIPVKLKISTKHVLPTNHNLSMYDQFRAKTMQEVDDVVEKYPDLSPDLGQLEPDTLPAEDDGVFHFDLSRPDDDPNEAPDPAEVSERLEALLDRMFSELHSSENSDRYIFTTEAEMEVLPGQITLTYDEADDSTLGKTKNIIRFDRANPHSLSIQRSGELMNTLVCEKGRRHTSVYTSPMLPMALEACTYTRRCDVDLDEEGGVVFLDYLIEIRGADVQRTTIRMDIMPLD